MKCLILAKFKKEKEKKEEPTEFKRKVWNTPPNTMRSLKEIAYILFILLEFHKL
jgi:hypothetical protein